MGFLMAKSEMNISLAPPAARMHCWRLWWPVGIRAADQCVYIKFCINRVTSHQLRPQPASARGWVPFERLHFHQRTDTDALRRSDQQRIAGGDAAHDLDAF